MGLTVLAAAAGITSTVLAADNGTGNGIFGKFRGQQAQNLTDAQKAEMQAKMDAVKAAITAGDYDAWVTAEKAINENSFMLTKMTAEKFKTYAEQYKVREAERADRQAKIDAVNAALKANDYNAWVTAEKAANEDSPILDKINSTNFSKYVEMHNLQTQVQSIQKELGIERGGQGFGPGGDMGGGRQGGGPRGDMGGGMMGIN